MSLHRVADPEPVHGYRFVLVNAVHAACEGVAIGAAMSVNLPFGIFMALVIAVHNIPEATNLGAVLRGHRLRTVDAAAVAVVANIPQVLLAIVVYAVAAAAPALVPWSLGFAAGTLVFLIPVLIIIFALRKHLLRGVTFGAIRQ